MRTTLIGIGVLWIGLLAGCSSDLGEHGSTLRRVDEHAMTSQVLYLVQGFAVPLTADQMDAQGHDYADAEPVRVEIYDNVAVAWYAPEGEALLGRVNIRALWQVVDRTPISDEIAPDMPGEQPAEDEPNTIRQDIPGLGDDLRIDEIQVTNPVGIAIIDFVNEYGSSGEAWMIEELGGSHPGCL